MIASLGVFIASRIDGRFELVAGAFSSTVEKSKASVAALGLYADRCYGVFAEMANHVHYPAAREFLKRGIHVIRDRPLASTLSQAKKLAAVAENSDAHFILTHNYTGYPMIRQARALVAEGLLGKIRVVQAEYPQDWLMTPLEGGGVKQAEWRTDPAGSEVGGCVGDIGTHAYNLAGFVTALTLDSLAADLTSFVEGRRLDDNVHVMLG